MAKVPKRNRGEEGKEKYLLFPNNVAYSYRCPQHPQSQRNQQKDHIFISIRAPSSDTIPPVIQPPSPPPHRPPSLNIYICFMRAYACVIMNENGVGKLFFKKKYFFLLVLRSWHRYNNLRIIAL